MSRGLSTSAPQTQMLDLLKQGPTASKGVSYCFGSSFSLPRKRSNRHQRLKLSKQDSVARRVSYCSKRNKQHICANVKEKPPLCIVYAWIILMISFSQPTITDWMLCWLGYISLYLFLLASVYESCCFLWLIYKKLSRIVLEPQAGSNSFSKMDPYLKEAIQVWSLFESLRDARTKRGMIAAITLYLQSHVKESLPYYLYRQIVREQTSFNDNIYEKVSELIDDCFKIENLVEDSDGLVILSVQDGGEKISIPWHKIVDDAFSNWKEFRHSAIAKKFTHFINVIVSAGMCSTADLSFKVGNVSLFSPIVIKKQLAASDVFEAFYEAVSGFMKGGWKVYQTGEVSAFFMEDDKISEFERMYNEIRSIHGYALAGNLEEYTETNDNDYCLLVQKSITFGDNLLKSISRSQTFERKFVSDRMDKLRDYQVEFTQLRTRGGLRKSPFAVCLFGQSGCGKSSLTNLTVNAGLLYNNLSADKDRIATWADNDKYASSVRSHINAIIFDDFANTKETFMDFSPAYRLIQVINNIRYLAPMADVFLKGKVSLNPYFCIVSTNVEHLNAAKYSNEPESVLRRMYHVKVEPKKECCVNGILNKRRIEQLYGRTSCPDAWHLTIRSYNAQNKRYVDLAAMTPIIFEGKLMEKVSVKEYLRWIQVASKKHFEEESQFLANQESLPDKCHTCDMLYCGCDLVKNEVVQEVRKPVRPPVQTNLSVETLPKLFRINGKSVTQSNINRTTLTSDNIGKPILTPESGVTNLSVVRPMIKLNCLEFIGHTIRGLYLTFDTSDFLSRKAESLQEYYRELSTIAAVNANLFSIWWRNFDFLPERMICHPIVLKTCLIFWKKDIKRSLIVGNVVLVICLFCTVFFCPSYSILWICTYCFLMYWYTCATVRTYQIMIRERILELKDVVKTFTNRWETKYALLGLSAIGIILATMRARYKQLEVNTGLEPANIEEVQIRNDAVNPWLVAKTVPLPMSTPSKTTTSDNLASAIRTNLVGVVSEDNKTTLGFYIVSNFVLLPTHFLEEHGDKDINIRCYKSTEGQVGKSFKDKISKSFRVDIPTTDFSLCFITSGGSMKDFRKFLPLGEDLRKCPAKLVTREIMGTSLQAIPTLYKGSGRVAHTKLVFHGSYYNLPVNTKPGMCMSPIISDMKGSTILGFHLGGKEKLGGCGTLTLDQVNYALSELSNTDGVVLSASCGNLTPNMGEFPQEVFGKEILQNEDIHPKSAVNFLTEGACIDIYGGTSGKATPKSNVINTIISDSVEEVFGIPQKWGPPKMKGKGRYPYQATLVHAAVPSLPIGSVLSKAVRSIKDLSIDLKARIPELFRVEPLSRVATVCGLDGVKFIDAMNFSSSPGFPLSGSKHPLLVDLPQEDYPEISKPRTFVPEVWDEFDKIVSILREGNRCYMIWKSCLKDEPTKLTKDKVRVFQSAPLVLQLLIRMYFLPIVRIIQMNPILFECAVGVNAEGLEWEELWESAMCKGKERVLAGDYSKYDVRMPAQVTIAAFDILIDLAEKCDGYSSQDIHIMKMLVHEVVYPVMAYNGDLIQLFGTNPSGQNLTVIINSLVNSLLLRSCFFTKYPEYDFKEKCAFLTYGDDVIGTVSDDCGDFTHITYADWLKEHDMKFTMPDKESKPKHYMHEEEVDFLKRKSIFNEDLGQKVGLLSEDSIFKRLHSHILSKELTLEMHSAQNIESSLHDWFYYGRDIFEDRREKLKSVAKTCNIEHLCPALNISYDKRVNQWRHKYLGEDLIEEEEVEPMLDVQCGDMYVSTENYLDHCRGTALDPYFWWEHYAIWLGLIVYPIIWILLLRGWYFKFGMIDYRWLVFLCITTGGFANLTAILSLIFRSLVYVYLPYWYLAFINKAYSG